MGRIRTKDIKKTVKHIIEKNNFTVDFEKNKDMLNKRYIIREKRARNRIAGYVTRQMRIKEENKM
ncbi:MAG: 30S ribosomal protein S17e [Candidatus Aenigmarchaeota archaeon]|nr:30S ribosomal protein S17e [Candidatus Aenigmarchaeota archaeon]